MYLGNLGASFSFYFENEVILPCLWQSTIVCNWVWVWIKGLLGPNFKSWIVFITDLIQTWHIFLKLHECWCLIFGGCLVGPFCSPCPLPTISLWLPPAPGNSVVVAVCPTPACCYCLTALCALRNARCCNLLEHSLCSPHRAQQDGGGWQEWGTQPLPRWPNWQKEVIRGDMIQAQGHWVVLTPEPSASSQVRVARC